MLNFYDVPAIGAVAVPLPPAVGVVAVPLPPAGLGTGAIDFKTAKNIIKLAWTPWFVAAPVLAPPAPIPMTINDIAFAMAIDSGAAMPPVACQAYCGFYLAGPFIAAQPWMGNLTPHHRRCADELLGVASSIATAQSKGYLFIASKTAMNAALPPNMHIWTKPWLGDGPDYVMDDGVGGISFLEVKGRASICQKAPLDFARHKAQSVNANLMNLQIRYLLSYAYFPANGVGTALVQATVQWFNATNPKRRFKKKEDDSQLRIFLQLTIAYCQFLTQMRNAGYDVNILETRASAEGFGFFEKEGCWVERKNIGEPRLVIPNQTRACFRRIQGLLVDVREKDDVNFLKELKLTPMLTKLNALRKGVRKRVDKISFDAETLHRYATGVYIIGNRH
jgi:hypothetical protein